MIITRTGAERPILSVCVPTYGADTARVARLAASVAEHTKHVAHEFVVADCERELLGYTKPMNAAMKAARGMVLAALNDDVEVSEGWIDPLLDALRNPNTWCATPDATATDGPQVFAPYCFPAGTRIRLASGAECPIEDIRLLDKVVTATGQAHTVVQTMVKFHVGHLVWIKLWGHNALRCTPEHPILTHRGYVAAGELQGDDWVALPRYSPQGAATIRTAPLLERIADKMKVRRWKEPKKRKIPGSSTATVVISPMPDEIALTPAFGRILGLFLAEGSIHRESMLWAFNYNERDTLVAELVELLRSELGIEARVQDRRVYGQQCINVIAYGTAWARLFESLCGTGAFQKRLHPRITEGPPDFLRAILYGWLAGDGSRKGKARSRRPTGVSVSHDLALAMFDIAQAQGLWPTLMNEKVRAGAKRRLDPWILNVNETPLESSASTATSWRVRQDDGFVWRKVRALEFPEFAGHVYNLGIEGEHSYVAEGVAVHNCMAWRREAWLAVGGLDERFFHWASDIDIAKRLIMLGHPPIRVRLPVPIRHELNATSRTVDVGRQCMEDLERFRAKWGIGAEDAKHQMAAEAPEPR